MLLTVWMIVWQSCVSRGALLQCDFETRCNDFLIDFSWDVTTGQSPQPLDHDHTLNSSSGSYLFYNPHTNFALAEIRFAHSLPIVVDHPLCFQLWYYTSHERLPFTVELLQGDDQQLTRVAASIPGKDPLMDDWTLINIPLPNERIKISIRTNSTLRPLAFDDLSVDYCDGPAPIPPKVLYQCDLESSCSDDFLSLPNYPYTWSILNANDTIPIENGSALVDSTFGNHSGHYALLSTSKVFSWGNVGYFHLRKDLQITSNESYCLNFQYYMFGRTTGSDLQVYLQTSDRRKGVQRLWPSLYANVDRFTMNKWTWAILHLPVGEYSLLFRVASSSTIAQWAALDDFNITSCAYPASSNSATDSYLNFSCAFDNQSMCGMSNDGRSSQTSFNFTVSTGDTVRHPELGPLRDHTSNAATGGFLYWDRSSTSALNTNGQVTSVDIELNLGMCIRFAYYLKSATGNKNATQLSVSVGGCYAAVLWRQSLDDSQGWRTVIIPAGSYACPGTFQWNVYHTTSTLVAVAFDDIEIDQCSAFSPSTTSLASTSTTTMTTARTSLSSLSPIPTSVSTTENPWTSNPKPFTSTETTSKTFVPKPSTSLTTSTTSTMTAKITSTLSPASTKATTVTSLSATSPSLTPERTTQTSTPSTFTTTKIVTVSSHSATTPTAFTTPRSTITSAQTSSLSTTTQTTSSPTKTTMITSISPTTAPNSTSTFLPLVTFQSLIICVFITFINKY